MGKMQSVVSNKAGKSKAMPFLSQPEGLDGSMAGDVGFDPLGFSSYIDVKWLREAAEARPYLHACLDWLRRPGGHPPPRPRVQPQVRPRGLGCCAPRWDALDPRGDRTHRNDLQQVPAHCNGHVREPLRQPGNLGFDPLSLSTPKNRYKYELAEVTHGRAAMMGLSGIIHQMIITKQGTIEQLMNFKSVDPAAFKGLAGLSTAPVLAGGAASWPF